MNWIRFEQDKSVLQAQKDALKSRLESANSEVMKANDDRVQMALKLDETKRAMQRLSHEKEVMVRAAKKEVSPNYIFYI